MKQTILLRPLIAAALLAGPLALGGAQAQEQDQLTNCRQQAGKEIDKLGVRPNVKDVSYYVKWVGQNRSNGVNVWVTLDNCRGDLVIEFNRACEVVEAYGHGDCGRVIPTTYGQ